MPGLQQVNDVLERVLGKYPMPFHDYFWRGKTRDELVAIEVFGAPMLVPGQPDASNLLRAMRGDPPREEGAERIGTDRLRKIFAQVAVAEEDVRIVDAWISQGCPETDVPAAATPNAAASVFAVGAAVSDDTHTLFWRAFDIFFLPSLASPVTRPHVIKVINFFDAWLKSAAPGGDLSEWTSFLAQPQNAASFDYVRHHHRRLIREFYGDSQEALLDSLWKFGGNLLPVDPESHALPNHTMNGVGDWFNWIPYLDASLRAPDVEAVDLDLARGWQVGIVADGLLRTDADRPEGERMPIKDFSADDADLRAKVFAKYVEADAATLIAEMVRRTADAGGFGALTD